MRFKRKERRMRSIPMTIFYELMGLLNERTWLLNLSSWNGALNGKRGYGRRIMRGEMFYKQDLQGMKNMDVRFGTK